AAPPWTADNSAMRQAGDTTAATSQRRCCERREPPASIVSEKVNIRLASTDEPRRMGPAFAGATKNRLIKPVKMMDRAVAVANAETVRRRNRGADPSLGVAHSTLHAL